MAQNTIASLYSTLNPAFNHMKYIINSTNKNEEGFRYVFDLYLAGTATKVAEYKIIPKPVTGYGEVDLARICQSLVSHNFDPALTSRVDATDSYLEFDLKVGEEFVVPIDYTVSVVQNGLYVKITATHTFVVGDQVTITQVDGGAANPNLEGLFTVLAVTGTTDFTVSSLWAEVTDATIDGTVLYADNRKTITRDITTFLDVTAFNGAFSFVDFITYAPTDFNLLNATDRLLTNLPTSGMRITPEQSMWMNAFTDDDVNFRMFFENSNGDTFDMDLTLAGKLLQVCVASPDIDASLNVLTGTAGLIKDDTEWYEFYVTNGGAQRSLAYRLDIDRRCAFNDHVVYFKDRLGSIASFAFTLKDRLTGTVTKTKYNQNVNGKVVGGRWVYDTFDKGQKSVNHSIDEVLELNTNYLNQTEIDYFTELMSSPDTWLLIDGQVVGCTIEDATYEQQRLTAKRLVRKTIRVKQSNQTVING